MKEWPEEFEILDEYEKNPDEYEQYEETSEDKYITETEIPDVPWAEDIEKIEDLEIRQKEIEAAERYLEKEKALSEKNTSGEINEFDYMVERDRLRDEGRRATTRSGIESVGLTWDHLGDLNENHDLILAGASGDLRPLKWKENLNKTIVSHGGDRVQEFADKKLEEGEIDEEAHKIISRQVRLSRK